MASNALATAYVQIVPKMDGFSSKLNSATASAGRSGGERYRGGFEGGVKAVAIGNLIANALTSAAQMGAAAIKNVVGAALNNYAQYEQLAGGVETLFKASADTVKKYAEDAYKTAGLSANEYMQTVTSFSASLLQSLGNDTAKASEKAHRAVVDMADNANKMGTNMRDIQNAYQGFAKQNYTMLDNLKLGYGGTKTEMQRLIKTANELVRSNQAYADEIGGIRELSIDSYADIVDAIHIVQTEMDITGTTAKEAADTIEGSVNAMKAQWQNWLMALGSSDFDLRKETEELVDAVIAAGKNVLPRLAAILGGLTDALIVELPKVFAEVKQCILDALPKPIADAVDGLIADLGTAIDRVGATLTPLMDRFLPNLQEAAPALISTLGGIVDFVSKVIAPVLDFVVDLLCRVSEVMIDLAPQVNDQLMPALSDLGDSWGNLWEKLQPILDPLQRVLELIGPVFIQAITLVIQLLGGVCDVLAGVLDAIKNIDGALKDAGTAISGFFGNVKGTFEGLGVAIPELIGLIGSNIKKGFDDAMSGAKQAVEDGINAVVNTVRGLPGTIIGIFAGAGSWLVESGRSLLDGFARGVSQQVNSVKDKVRDALQTVRNLFPFSPAKEGPFSGKGWTLYSGMSLMDGLAEGIAQRSGSAADAMRSAMGDISAAADASAAFGTMAPAGAFASGGSTTNVYIDGASVNADEDVKALFMQFMESLAMTNRMVRR